MYAVSISGGCCVAGKSSVFVVFLGGQTKYLQIFFLWQNVWEQQQGSLWTIWDFSPFGPNSPPHCCLHHQPPLSERGEYEWCDPGVMGLTRPWVSSIQSVGCFVTNRKAELQTPNPTPACLLINCSHWVLASGLSLPALRAIPAIFQVLHCGSAAHERRWKLLWACERKDGCRIISFRRSADSSVSLWLK